jgi:hypothetical protein
MSRQWRISVSLCVVLMLGGLAVADDDDPAAESSLRFQTTVEFSNMQKTELEGSAGDVQLTSVEFVASNVKSGGIAGAFSSSDKEVEVSLTTSIGCANTSDTKVKLDFLVEFLDGDGELIDRATASDSIKNKDKVFVIKHTTLRWALDHIKKARISVAAKP